MELMPVRWHRSRSRVDLGRRHRSAPRQGVAGSVRTWVKRSRPERYRGVQATSVSADRARGSFDRRRTVPRMGSGEVGKVTRGLGFVPSPSGGHDAPRVARDQNHGSGGYPWQALPPRAGQARAGGLAAGEQREKVGDLRLEAVENPHVRGERVKLSVGLRPHAVTATRTDRRGRSKPGRQEHTAGSGEPGIRASRRRIRHHSWDG
jgi:hypothetical protein